MRVLHKSTNPRMRLLGVLKSIIHCRQYEYSTLHKSQNPLYENKSQLIHNPVNSKILLFCSTMNG